MATFLEPIRPFEFLITEAPGTLSRETVTIVAGSLGLVPGMVLGKITVGGKYAPYDNDNANGTEVAAAILLEAVDATADVSAAVIARIAEVKSASLQWASTVAAGEKAPAYVDLALQHIIVR